MRDVYLYGRGYEEIFYVEDMGNKERMALDSGIMGVSGALVSQLGD